MGRNRYLVWWEVSEKKHQSLFDWITNRMQATVVIERKVFLTMDLAQSFLDGLQTSRKGVSVLRPFYGHRSNKRIPDRRANRNA